MADMRRRRQEILSVSNTPSRSSSPKTEKGHRSASPNSRAAGTTSRSRSPSPSSKTTLLSPAAGEMKAAPVVTQEEYEQLRKLKAACHRRIGYF